MSVTTRCASSHMMSGLLAWRNPKGQEEKWLGHNQRVPCNCKHVGKVNIAAIGLKLLTLTSFVETVAYSTLAVLTFVLYPVNDRPCHFFAKLLQSSTFTFLWATATNDNATYRNVITHESFARYKAQMFLPQFFKLLRLEDALYIANWAQQHRQIKVNVGALEPMLAVNQAMQTIHQGAPFINKKELVVGVNDEDFEPF